MKWSTIASRCASTCTNLQQGGPLYYLYEYFDALRSSKQITEAEYKHAVGLINLRSNQFEKEIHAEFLERIRLENNAL